MSGTEQDQLAAALADVATVVEEIGETIERLAAAGDIPWSGAAAHAWRDDLDAGRRGVGGGRGELRELHEALLMLRQALP